MLIVYLCSNIHSSAKRKMRHTAGGVLGCPHECTRSLACHKMCYGLSGEVYGMWNQWSPSRAWWGLLLIEEISALLPAILARAPLLALLTFPCYLQSYSLAVLAHPLQPYLLTLPCPPCLPPHLCLSSMPSCYYSNIDESNCRFA